MAEKTAAPIATTCKQCRRCVYTTDLDRDGYCCFCTAVKVTPGKGAPAALSGDAGCTDGKP